MFGTGFGPPASRLRKRLQLAGPIRGKQPSISLYSSYNGAAVVESKYLSSIVPNTR
jgi:hypothetical protein